METEKKAVLLLSGGLDSYTTLAIAQRDGYQVYGLSFRYGQRHRHEVAAAERIAQTTGLTEHVVFDIDFASLVSSALTADIPVPKHATVEDIEQGIPVTYVPARNTLFLSLALGWAEHLGAHDIFIGVNALDYSGYPDCRPEYLEAFERLANLATKAAVEADHPWTIHAPLLHMTKAEIVATGLSLGVDYALTTSCYDPAPTGRACGHCDACLLRKKGFAENGQEDPIDYVDDLPAD